MSRLGCFKTCLEPFNLVTVWFVEHNEPARLQATVHKIMNWLITAPKRACSRIKPV